MFTEILELEGLTFHSRVKITIEMAELGGLYKGEGIRIIEDISDQIAKTDFKCRWETYSFHRESH